MKVLLTGPPGCGKTSLVERVVERVRGRARLAGFFTSEVREGGGRVGFDVVTVDGRRAVLSRKGRSGGPRVGSYTVDLASFEAVGVASLHDKEADAFVIDEIGLMELYSEAFREVVMTLLEGSRPLLATIRSKSEPFCDTIKSRRDVELIVVSSENRDALVEELSKRMLVALGKV
jgi:nucleoside-triphosphatase THEP1